jgi:hypothetical protein
MFSNRIHTLGFGHTGLGGEADRDFIKKGMNTRELGTWKCHNHGERKTQPCWDSVSTTGAVISTVFDHGLNLPESSHPGESGKKGDVCLTLGDPNNVKKTHPYQETGR